MTEEHATATALTGALLLLLMLALAAARLAVFAVRLNRAMAQAPSGAVAYCHDEPLAPDRIRAVHRDTVDKGLDWRARLPPRQHRRYIVVGGSGSVGSHIVLALLATGVPPRAIRIVDARPPPRRADDPGVPFVQADITSAHAARQALAAPWPDGGGVAQLPLTVFHTAAVIRPFERNPLVYDRCRRVNVAGTANVLAAAGHAGAGVFIFTSSSSVGGAAVDWFAESSSSSAAWWRLPRPQPTNQLQVMDASDFSQPLRPPHCFPSCYSRSKAEAERLVCAADRIRVGEAGDDKPAMRTGAIRPGNGVYGAPGDFVIDRMLAQRRAPTFSAPWVHNWVHVANVALAHVQYEAALLGPHSDAVSGRPFLVTDDGPAMRFRDIYAVGATLSTGGLQIIYPPPLLMLLMAYAVEAYCSLIATVPILQIFLREPGDPLCLFQPAVFSSAVSTIIDDSQSRKSAEDGGFGYSPFCNTVQGLSLQIEQRNAGLAAKAAEDVTTSARA
ncbi:hypothetical protein S7711_07861 [Stachybotrys chartarum IBT 7711]|uniref:3-beta hydroxysteroid dehydrogenase/isomerase domain-containing protein n=1 Tax=Stachybotrys chartarum (strain CBS 109288 / IBT 7711) TaxID=1280523 RepID=A0A084AXP7_STACB|nr:hypothetical protein S7711_07861 [Stachybotrys chartarum IBT 7711]KFA52495.1 hypothetical protein S40293_05666 [Stachybotrys chartarum IBT 40293]